MQKSNSKYSSELILIFVTLLWGATFVFVKEALTDISSMAFIAIRFLIAGLVLLPFMMKKTFDPKAIKAGVLLGFVLFMGFATQTIGLKFTTATNSGFLTGTAVIMIPLLQILIEKRAPSKGVIVGSIIVLAGISFLSSGGSSIVNLFSDMSSNFNFGDGLTLISAFFFALYMIFLDMKTTKFDFGVLLFLQIITTAVLSIIGLFIFSLAELEQIRINVNSNLITAILYTSIFATLITTALQTKYQKNVTPAKAGIIFSLEPIFAGVTFF